MKRIFALHAAPTYAPLEILEQQWSCIMSHLSFGPGKVERSYLDPMSSEISLVGEAR